jgi:hypothetical protein
MRQYIITILKPDRPGRLGWHKDKGPVPVDEATVFTSTAEAKRHAPRIQGAAIEKLDDPSGPAICWLDNAWR